MKNLFFDKRDKASCGRHILMVGEPGAGKTTMCRKLAYDWSCEDRRISRQDDLLYLVFVDTPFIDLMDYMLHQLSLNRDKIKREDLIQIFSLPNVKENTLFVMDLKSSATKIPISVEYPRMKIFTESYVLVTSRFEDRSSMLKDFDMCYTIVGFSANDHKFSFVDKFIRNVGGGEKLRLQLHDLLLHDVIVSQLAVIPTYLMFMCLLLHDHCAMGLPISRTNLYKGITSLSIRRGLRKNKHSPIHENTVFLKLGEKAFQMLINKQETIDCTTGINSILSLLIHSGIIVSVTAVSPLFTVKQYAFRHKSFLDYFAAKYIIWTDLRLAERFFHDACKKQKRETQILYFLCGLLRGQFAELEYLFRSIVLNYFSGGSGSEGAYSHSDHHIPLICLYESGAFPALKSIQSRLMPPVMHLSSIHCGPCLAGYGLLDTSIAPYQWSLDCVQLEDSPLFCQQLEETFSKKVVGGSVKLYNCTNVTFVSYLVGVMCLKTPCLNKLSLYTMSSETLAKSNTDVSLSCQQKIASKSLALYGTTESSSRYVMSYHESMLYFISLLMRMDTIEVEFNQLMLTEEIASFVGQRIGKCDNLCKLNLGSITWRNNSLSFLLSGMMNLKLLENVILVNFNFDDDTHVREASAMLGHILSTNPIVTLGLSRLPVSLVLASLTKLEGSVHLCSLDLSHNVFHYPCWQRIFNIISTLRCLSSLTLQKCAFDKRLLATALYSMSHLKRLDISYNTIGQQWLFMLTPGLIACRSLTDVMLSGCNIDDKCLMCIKELISERPLLVLHLLSNKLASTDKTLGILASVLYMSSTLTDLRLSLENQTSQTIVYLSEHLIKNTCMETLYIATNPHDSLIGNNFDKVYKHIYSILPSLQQFGLGIGDDLINIQSPSN